MDDGCTLSKFKVEGQGYNLFGAASLSLHLPSRDFMRSNTETCCSRVIHIDA